MNHGLEACSCVLKIRGRPLGCSVRASCAAEVVGVLAIVVPSKGVVETICFDDNFDCCVVGPFETKKSREEILGTLSFASVASSIISGFGERAPRTCLQHAVLSCCTSNNLTVRVIKLGVLTTRG